MPNIINWEFFLQRKQISLEVFLSSTQNLNEAKEKFSLRGLDPPNDTILIEHFKKKNTQHQLNIEEKSKPKKTLPRKKKSTSKKEKSLKESSSQESKSLDDKKIQDDTKYFRKVFPAKKK